MTTTAKGFKSSKFTSKKYMLAMAVAAAGSILFASAAHANVYYWDNNSTTSGFGTAGGTWGSSTNSIPGNSTDLTTDTTGVAATTAGPTTTADTLNFGTNTAGQGLAAGTVTVTGTQNIGNIVFGSQSGSVTLSGGTINLAAAGRPDQGTAADIVVNSTNAAISSNITIAGASTTAGFSLGGIGTLTFTGTMTQSGMMGIVGSATLSIGTGGSVTNSGGNGILWGATGTTLALNGGSFTDTGNNGTNASILYNLTMNSGTASFGSSAAGTTHVGLISGGTVNLNGGTLSIESFTGDATNTVNFNGGTLTVLDAQALSAFLPSPIVAKVQAGGVIINTGTFNPTIGAILAHDSALGATPDGGLTKLGTGTLTLSTTETYTGGTTVNGGMLRLSGGDNSVNIANTSSVTINSGGTISIVGSNNYLGGAATKTTTINAGGTLTIGVNADTSHLGPLVLAGGNLSTTGTPGGNGAGFGSYDLDHGVTAGGTTATSIISALDVALTQSGGTIFNVSAGASNGIDLNVTGTIYHSGTVADTGLIKQGNGVMALTGTNTYASGTTISAGTLQIGGSGSLGSGAYAGAIANSGRLQFSSTAAQTLSGVISGTGALIKDTSSASTLTLSNFNTYTGGTTVNAGTLVLGSAGGGAGNGYIVGTLTIGSAGTVVLSTVSVFGYNSAATGLATLNINGGTLDDENTNGTKNETFTGVTVNMTGGTWSSGNGYFQFFSNGFGNTTVNTLASSTPSVISTRIDLRQTNTVFTVASGTVPSGIDLLVSGSITINSGGGITKAGPGLMELTASNTYTGGTTISAGTLGIGISNSGTTSGALGPSTAAVTLGNASGSSNARLLTEGAFTFSNAITVANGSSGNTLTLGGATDNNSTFSGLITLNNNLTIAQPVTATTNALSLTGGIKGGSGGAETVTFAGPGLINVGTTAITDNTGTNPVAVTVAAGTTSFNFVNTYSGATNITGGTLALGVTNAIGGTSAVTVNGGTLAVGTVTDSVGAVLLQNGKITGSTGMLTGTSYGVQSGLVSANLGGGGIALTKSTAGSVTLSGSNSYTGATTINAGKLIVNGSLANTAVSVGSSGTLGGTGTINGTVNVSGGINLLDGVIGTLTLTNGLTTTNGSNLSFEVNAPGQSDLINITGGTLTAGASNVSITNLGGLALGTYTLMSFLSGQASGLGNLALATPFIGSLKLTLSSTSTAELLTVANATNLFWKGAQGSGGNGTWNTLTGGTISNWTLDSGGATNSGTTLPNSTYDIFFIATGGTNLNTTLGVDTDIHSLNFNATASSSVTIGGSSKLTIEGSGITIDAGSGAHTISTTGGVVANANQVWSNNSSNLFTVSSGITQGASSGVTALTLNGSGTGGMLLSGNIGNGSTGGTLSLIVSSGGTVTLSGSNTYTGGTAISNGTLNLGSGNALGASGVISMSGGTLQYSASNAADYSGRLSTAGNQAFTIDTNGRAVTFASVIQGTNTSLTKLGAGTLTLSTNNTYTGATTVNNGTLVLNGGQGVGAIGTIGNSTSIVVNNGGTILSNGNNSFVGVPISGAKTIQINTGGTVSNTDGSTSHLDALILNGGTLSATTANGTFGNWNFDFGVSTPGNGTTSAISGGNAGLTQAGGTIFNVGATDIVNVSTALQQLSGLTNTGLIKNGSGTLTLSTTNTYTSATTINQGALNLTGTLGTSGGTAISSAATFTEGSTGVIAGTSSLAISGGTTVLAGVNTYNGGTTISAGLLQLNNALAAQNSTVTVSTNNGLTFGTGIGTVTLGGLSGGSNFALTDTGSAAVTLLVGNNNASTTYSGVMSGSGALTMIGTGSLTLSNLNTYTGGTTVNAGALVLAANGNGVGDIRGTLTIGPGGKVVVGTVSVFGYNSAATGLATLNINGGILDDETTPTTNETFTGVTVNMTGGTWSSGNGFFQFFSNGFGNTTVNTFSSPTTAVISTRLDLRQANLNSVFTVASGTVPSGIDLLVSGQITETLAGSGITKAGPGLMQLSGSNIYTGTTTISQGTLSAGNIVVSGGSSNLGNATSAVILGDTTHTGILSYTGNTTTYTRGFTLNAGGGEVDVTTAGQNLTVGTANITGTGGLTKGGAGSLTLNTSNVYSGNTTVSAGSLFVANTAGSATGAGTVTIASGAALVGSQTSGQGFITGKVNINGGGNLSAFSTGSLTISGTGGLTLDADNSTTSPVLNFTLTGTPNSSTPLINVTGSAGFAVNVGAGNTGKTTVNVTAGSSLQLGTYDLIGYTSGSPTFANFNPTATVASPSVAYTYMLSNPANQIDLTVAIATLTWTGADSTAWDTTTSSINWANPSNAASYYADPASVAFNDTNAITSAQLSSPQSVVIRTGGVSPTSVTFNNSAVNYSLSNFGGDTTGITGGTGITKNGIGTVTLTSPNTYNSGTTINAGTLQITNTGALSTGGVTFGASGTGTLALAATGGSQTYSNTIDASNGGAITISGALAATVGDLTIGGNDDQTNTTLSISSPSASPYSLTTGVLNLYAYSTVNIANSTGGSGQLIVNNGLSGALAGNLNGLNLIKTGSGTLTIAADAAPNSLFDGELLYINQGVVQANSTNALGYAGNALAVIISTGGTLSLGGSGSTINVAALADGSGSGSVLLNGKTLQLGNSFIGGNTFTGVIADGSTAGGGLTVDGTGGFSQVLAGQSTYTGPTTITNNGILRIAIANALPTTTDLSVNGSGSNFDLEGNIQTVHTLNGSGYVNNSGGATTFTVSNGGTFSGAIAGSNLALNVSGGTLILNGSSNSVAAVSVGGTLLVGDASNPSASLTSTGVTVNSGGILGGHGTITGPVTVSTGGQVQPGGSIGTLTIAGAYTQGSNTFLSYILDDPTSGDYSMIDVTGGLLTIGTGVEVDVSGTLDVGTYHLFTYGTDGLSGTTTGWTAVGIPGGDTYSFSTLTNHEVDLIISPMVEVPEPASLGLLGFGALALLGRKRSSDASGLARRGKRRA